VTDVLIGQAYALRLDPKLQAAGQPYAPLGALYAAAVARSRGHRVALYDAMIGASAREWDDALVRHRPQVAVLYEDGFNYLTKMCLLRVREAGLAMVAAARERGCTVLVSSSDATDHPEPYLAAGARAVVAGEGEVTLAETLEALEAQTSLDGVAGLILRAGDGSVRRTARRPTLRDLDTLPAPAWDLVDVAAYRARWRKKHGYFAMNAVTTRGCPYHCNWCAKPIYGQRYAVRGPEAVAAEMAWLKGTYAPDRLSFFDDLFGLAPGWVEGFADHVVAQRAAIPFKCLSRADRLDDATVAALARAGCREVWMGAESGSQKILDAMEKGTTVEQIREATRRLRAQGIAVGFFLQFGYPGEGLDEIRETLDLVRDCRPEDVGISVAYPLPGTRFYERVRSQLGAKQNWDDSDDLAMMYKGPFPTEFYRTLHRVVHHERRLQGASARPGAPRRLRRAASFLYAAGSLPIDRWRLRRLAQGARGTAPLPTGLSRADAATPSAVSGAEAQ
jgi:anaerobic magnesium-protoporphyrin IX monomethyl ester cyclase